MQQHKQHKQQQQQRRRRQRQQFSNSLVLQIHSEIQKQIRKIDRCMRPAAAETPSACMRLPTREQLSFCGINAARRGFAILGCTDIVHSLTFFIRVCRVAFIVHFLFILISAHHLCTSSGSLKARSSLYIVCLLVKALLHLLLHLFKAAVYNILRDKCMHKSGGLT